MKYLFFLLIPVLLLFACEFDNSNKTDAFSELNGKEAEPYMEKGRKVSAATFALLSSTLKSKLESVGPLEAVSYCNTAAMALTDSIAKAENVSVKRTSLKWRNPSNKPTEWEEKILKLFESQKERGEELFPKVFRFSDAKTVYVSPILMLPLCTKCHGKSIDSGLQEKLKTLYPNDMATGYEAGDLRGIWSITFNN